MVAGLRSLKAANFVDANASLSAPPEGEPVEAADSTPPAGDEPAAAEPSDASGSADSEPLAADSATGAGGAKLEGDALAQRLARERNKVLKEHYGTDDPAEIAKIKAGYEEAKAAASKAKRLSDARKRARMTQEQRVQETVAEKDARIKELEGRIETIHNDSWSTSKTPPSTRCATSTCDQLASAMRVAISLTT